MADCQIALAGVRMNNDQPDADGVVWHVETVDGWDSPPVRTDDADLTGRHGGFGPSRLFGARLLTVQGLADSPDMATAFRVRERLHQMPGFSAASLIVHEPVAKSLTVVSGGAPRSSWPMDAYPFSVTWQIPLVAYDPFKLGLTQRALAVAGGATVVAEHDGTAAADLTATTTSAGTVQLTVGGLTLTTSSVPAGTVFDTASCTVTGPDGADLYGAVANGSQWPALPAGGGNVTQAGTANLDITYRDTYA